MKLRIVYLSLFVGLMGSSSLRGMDVVHLRDILFDSDDEDMVKSSDTKKLAVPSAMHTDANAKDKEHEHEEGEAWWSQPDHSDKKAACIRAAASSPQFGTWLHKYAQAGGVLSNTDIKVAMPLLNVKDSNGKTALDIAEAVGNTNLARQLKLAEQANKTAQLNKQAGDGGVQ